MSDNIDHLQEAMDNEWDANDIGDGEFSDELECWLEDGEDK